MIFYSSIYTHRHRERERDRHTNYLLLTHTQADKHTIVQVQCLIEISHRIKYNMTAQCTYIIQIYADNPKQVETVSLIRI